MPSDAEVVEVLATNLAIVASDGGCDAHEIARDALAAIRSAGYAVVKAADRQFPQYGCHLDLFDIPDGTPDDCVINEGRPDACIYAAGKTHPCQCEYWRAVQKDPTNAE